MFKALIKKLITLTVLTTALTPALQCFDAQRDYFYLSVLIHNANAAAFTKQLDQLAASSGHLPAFKQMLTTLARDVDHALLNTQAMHGADISGNIADNGHSQCKWGIGELALAAGMYILHKKYNVLQKEYNLDYPLVYYGTIVTGFSSGMLGVLSLKNSFTNYLLSRRYGKHIQSTLESLEEIKKQIAVRLNA